MTYDRFVRILNLVAGDGTWRELAIDSGVSYWTIAKIARGQTRRPVPSTVVKLIESMQRLRIEERAAEVERARRRIPALLRR